MIFVLITGCLLAVCVSTETGQECSAPPDLQNGQLIPRDRSLTTWPDGTTLEYECRLGYSVQGGRSITCNNGMWSRLYLRCNEITCPYLEPPENGFLVDNAFDNIPGRTIEFSCNPGYDVIGRGTLRCFYDGFWNPPRPPTCRVKICPDTSYLSHGTKFQDTLNKRRNQYGNTESYSCEDGYRLVGPRERTCTESGEWSEAAPVCEELACDEPSPIYNGRLLYPNGKRGIGDIVYFICNEDSDLEYSHRPYAICQTNEEWNIPTTQCLKKLKPSILRNGVRTYNNGITVTRATDLLRFNTAVTSQCNEFFELAYSDEVYADKDRVTSVNRNGSWVPAMPSQCNKARCILPLDETITAHIRERYTVKEKVLVPHGMLVNFTCTSNYEFANGKTVIRKKCLRGNLDTPTCRARECKRSSIDIEHGHSTVIDGPQREEIRHGRKVQLSCIDGYELFRNGYNPPNSTRCIFGKFIGMDVLPECVEERCSLAENGNTQITYENGTEAVAFVEHGTTVYFSCKRGYRQYPESTSSAECIMGDMSIPECIKEGCDITPVEHGRVRYSRTSITEPTTLPHEANVTVRCKNGYELNLNGLIIDSFQTSCFLGRWNEDTLPTCTERGCVVEALPNGYVLTNGAMVAPRTPLYPGSTIQVGCHKGYELWDDRYISSFTATCSLGSWSPNIAACVARRCFANEKPTGNFDLRPPVVQHGEYFQMRCNDGFHLRAKRFEGNDGTAIVCNQGNFSIPFCSPKKCKVPIVDNSNITRESGKLFPYPNAQHGTKLKVVCNEGFELQSSTGPIWRNFSTACFRGNWTLPFPSCANVTAVQMVSTEANTTPSATSEGVASTTEAATSTISTTPSAASSRNVSSTRPVTQPTAMATTVEGRQQQQIQKGSCAVPELLQRIYSNSYSDEESEGDDHTPSSLTVIQNGDFINILCYVDGYPEEKNLTCQNGTFDGSWEECQDDSNPPERCTTLANGEIEYANGNVHVTCNEGYSANYRFQLVCRNGVLISGINNNEVICEPDGCLVPSDLGDRTVKKDETVYLAYSRIEHLEEVNITCPDAQEPANRIFTCIAGTWYAEDGKIWEDQTRSDSFPACRRSRCWRPCENGGTCIRDNECSCPEGTGGIYCEEIAVLCQPPCQNGGTCTGERCICPDHTYGDGCQNIKCKGPDVTHYTPKRPFYYAGEKVDIICSRYYGKDSALTCQTDGTWNGVSACLEGCPKFNITNIWYPRWSELDGFILLGKKITIEECFLLCRKQFYLVCVSSYLSNVTRRCYGLPRSPRHSIKYFTRNIFTSFGDMAYC